MEKNKKYRLGNQAEEYELKEDYIGWYPKREGWANLYLKSAKNKEVRIVSPNNRRGKTLFLHCCITKDSFPPDFFTEERSKKWINFLIVSDDEYSEKFVIPIEED